MQFTYLIFTTLTASLVAAAPLAGNIVAPEVEASTLVARAAEPQRKPATAPPGTPAPGNRGIKYNPSRLIKIDGPGSGRIAPQNVARAQDLTGKMDRLERNFVLEHRSIFDEQHRPNPNQGRVNELKHKDNAHHIEFNGYQREIVSMGGPVYHRAPGQAYDSLAPGTKRP